MSNLILSPKYGVNPTMTQCYICGEQGRDLLLLGRLRDDAPAPLRVAWSDSRCTACAEKTKTHIALIRATKRRDGPDRTGTVVFVLADEFLPAVFSAELRADVARKRLAFLPLDVWAALELPIAGEDTVPAPQKKETDDAV